MAIARNEKLLQQHINLLAKDLMVKVLTRLPRGLQLKGGPAAETDQSARASRQAHRLSSGGCPLDRIVFNALLFIELGAPWVLFDD